MEKDKCPICNSRLFERKKSFFRVMDGNIVYDCFRNDSHVFWRNMREVDILHLNINASETNFKSDADYKFINNEWIKVETK